MFGLLTIPNMQQCVLFFICDGFEFLQKLFLNKLLKMFKKQIMEKFWVRKIVDFAKKEIFAKGFSCQFENCNTTTVCVLDLDNLI